MTILLIFTIIRAMTLANKLTILRIVLLPFFAAAIALARESIGFVLAALVIFICIGASDYLDGYFARKRGEKTRLGSVLDPVADKLTMATATILLGTDLWPEFSRLMPVTVIAVVGRDLILVVATVIIARVRKAGISATPSMIGKLSTTFQMSLIPFVLLFQFLNEVIPGDLGGLQTALCVMQWWVIAWVAISLADYSRRAVIMLRTPPVQD